MDRNDVIFRLKTVEPASRAHGVGALFLFGSYGRGEPAPQSDVDVFVDAGTDGFYDLDHFMGAYATLQAAFPETNVGYSTREGLSLYIRRQVEREAIRVF